MIGLAVVTAALIGGPATAPPPRSAPAVRIARISLSPYGWRPPRPPRAYGEGDGPPGPRVAVDTRGRVLVGFTTRGTGDGLAPRAAPNLWFHVLRFADDSGPDLAMRVPTNNWMGNAIYLDDRDETIARADDKLQLLLAVPVAPDPTAGSWRPLAPCGPHCWIKQSPSRRTLLLGVGGDPTEPLGYRVTVIGPGRGGHFIHCSLPSSVPPGAVSITDAFAYFNADPGNLPYPPPVLYRWPLCGYSQRRRLTLVVHGLVKALSDQLLLFGPFYPNRDVATLYDVTGGHPIEKLRLHLGRDDQGSVVFSQDGRRALVRATTFRGGAAWLDISPHATAERVIVLDLLTGAELASVPVIPNDSLFQAAISPDGRRVAALAKDTLTIADIP